MKCEHVFIYRMYHYFEWWSEDKVTRILKLAADEGGFKLHAKLTVSTVSNVKQLNNVNKAK